MDYYNPVIVQKTPMESSPTSETETEVDKTSIDSKSTVLDESYDASDEGTKANRSPSDTSSETGVDEGVEVKEENEEKAAEKNNKMNDDKTNESPSDDKKSDNQSENGADESAKKTSIEKLKKFFGENYEQSVFQMSRVETIAKEKWSDISSRYHRIKEQKLCFDGAFAAATYTLVDYAATLISIVFLFYFLAFSIIAQAAVTKLPDNIKPFIRRFVPEADEATTTKVSEHDYSE